MRIIIALLAIIFSSEIKCMIVETQNGPILGKIETSVLGKDYFSFQKIPYMKPPLNELQFKDPQPPTNWTLPLDCTIEGPRFPQIDLTFEDFEEDKFKGSLDSMHINVFTTKLKPAVQNESLPVLVWIHGGGMNGFGVGSGTSELYGPDYFMEKDVVLVTFNYRLHVYGFLSLDDQSVGVPGNAGLKDQRMALKWVRDNIENFGGNNKNITVFGHSSGSGSIHYHLISESSKNLFQKSVLMSGTASDLHGIVPRKNWAFKLAKKLNYTGEEKDEDILKFLEKIEPYQIFKASSNLLTHDEKLNEHIFEAFGPTIEPYQTPNSFLLDFPENLYRNSWGNDVNILIGANSFENGLFINLINEFPFLVEEMSDFRTIMMTNFNRKFSEYDELKNAEKLKKTYYGMLEPSLTNIDGVVYVRKVENFMKILFYKKIINFSF
jgi:cholinesterase